MAEKRACFICILAVFLVFLLVGGGFLLGHGFAYFKKLIYPSSNKVAMHRYFRDIVSTAELKDSLRYFSKRPHIAGSERQKEMGEELARRWRSYGFDKVEMPEYQVLLSFPQKDKPNLVTLRNKDGTTSYQSKGTEQVVDPSENDTMAVPPFLGYAPPGTVEGELVYVNYGRLEDFKELKEKLGIDITGKIAIMRYGNNIYRGDKIANAANNGAIGALLYTDPIDYALEGTAPNDTYPNTPWLPATGVQRGSIYSGHVSGDPQTPGLPAIPGMYRRPYNESELPTIPAQPISYGDAMQFMSKMEGKPAPEEWKGALNISYNIGPSLANGMRVKLEVNNKLEVKSIYNVIGTIYGREEPDRYVLMGNHRDAWVFGAVDASTGTAVTTETARGLGELLKKNWRPRRTIMMCSWGGEEFNMIGSHEWVEEHIKAINTRAIAYLNVDVAIGGNFVLQSVGSPILKGVIMSQLRKVSDPNGHGDVKSIYDVMVEREPSEDVPPKPKYNQIGAGSDYAPFYYSAGVPVADFMYTMGHNNKSHFYPVYHSQHDTFNWMEKFGDPEFSIHKAVAQFSGSLLLKLSDSPLLPLTIADYANKVNTSFVELMRRDSEVLSQHNISLEYLEDAARSFQVAARIFLGVVAKARWKSEWEDFSQLRRLNDQMVQVEKSFIYSYGLPGRPYVRHVLFAPELHNWYGSTSFPGIVDAIYTASQSGGSWDDVRKQISIVLECVLSATEAIQPFPKV